VSWKDKSRLALGLAPLLLTSACAAAPQTMQEPDPVAVSVTIEVDDAGCTAIVPNVDPVKLWKNAADEPHRGIWTWVGNQHGFDHLYFVLKESDTGLGACLPSVFLGPLDSSGKNYRGFLISRSGTDPGRVSQLSSCNPGEYKHMFIATRTSGAPCVQDPKVKIED